MTPKVGQLLYRGCACDEFAKVLRVGKDANGVDVIDVELVESINELYFPTPADDTNESRMSILTRIELPEGTPVRINDVQWKPSGDKAIECFMTTGGCFRCTSLFYPHEEGTDAWGEQ